MKKLGENVWMWSWFSEEKGYSFNGFCLQMDKAKVLVDPVKLDESAWEELEALGPFEAIYLTNKDHERMAYEIRQKLNVKIWIHEKDQDLLKEKADHAFKDDEVLSQNLKVIHLPNQKSPGESALYWEKRKTLILGDALIGVPEGELKMLPSQKYKDIEAAKASLKRLGDVDFDCLLLGDGSSILKDAKRTMYLFFDKQEASA